MALSDLTPASVVVSITEFDRVGRSRFLRDNGFDEARDYFVRHDGQLYDSKAIAGYAHGLATGVPMRGADFSGGDATVAKVLRGLGFTVTQPFDWTHDEIVLACELVYRNGWRGRNADDAGVQALSELLQRLPSPPVEERSPRFRNPNGVARKTYDIATQHPDYAGTPTRGNKLDRDVLQEFIADPARMTAEAAAIRERLGSLPLTPAEPKLAREAANAGQQMARDPHEIRGITYKWPKEPKHPAETEPRAVELVPSEQNTVTEFEIAPRAGAIATKEEAKMVVAFEAHLRSKGHDVQRARIPIPGEKNTLVTDPYDLTTGVLYEAKSGVERATIRLGVGQLLDYLRFLPEARGALLLPGEPSADLQALIHSCGFGLAFRRLGSWIEKWPDAP